LEEVWKGIDGYDDYQVSNLGNVRSLNYNHTGVAKNLVQTKHREGYYRLSLWADKKPKWFFVHRLVAQAFIPNPNDYPIINHKDEDKTNNNADNLEWCSQKYNLTYGTKVSYVARRKPIFKICKSTNKILERYCSAKQAGLENGICDTTIIRVANGEKKRKSAGGFAWRYE
jgi:16S rRNA A1518/A1519 N6-dimethyltransferase RsmA/KsgA/DIM1 with predicted DNA glycosylase/AP lyase activity